MDSQGGLISPSNSTTIETVKPFIIAILLPLLLSSCGIFKKKEEVGPYGDNRSRWEKVRTYEEDRYDNWADKWMHRDQYKRRKDSGGDSGIRN